MSLKATTPEGQASIDQINQIRQDVDLLRYVFALADAKWLILTAGILCGGLSLLHAKKTPNTYAAAVRTDMRDIRDPGGVKPDTRRMPEAIGMLEHGFVLETLKDNYTDVMLLRMKSHAFTRHFLDENNIYQYLFKEDWDQKTQSWRGDFVPDKGFAQKRFKAEMLTIVHDKTTDIIAVRMSYTNPKIASMLANKFVKDFNEFMRRDTLSESKRKINYIEKNLEHTQVIEIQKMLFRLMEAQTAAAMLANARQDYVLEVLDPAIPPLIPAAPNRKMSAILGGMGGMFLAVSGVIFLQIFGSLREGMQNYVIRSGRKPIAKRRWGIRAWLYKCYLAVLWIFRRRR